MHCPGVHFRACSILFHFKNVCFFISRSDDRVHSDSKFEDLLVRCERTEPDAELVNTENQQQPDIVKAPVKKRRWKKTVISKNYK